MVGGLVERECLGKLPRFTLLTSWCIQPMVGGLVERECLAVKRHTEYQFACRSSALNPVVDSVIHIKVVELVIWMFIERSYVSGSLVPVTVVVVCHHVDPVEVTSDAGYVVADVHDLLTRRDGGRKEKIVRSKRLLKLANPGGKGGLILV